jgi:hypothetical protein
MAICPAGDEETTLRIKISGVADLGAPSQADDAR